MSAGHQGHCRRSPCQRLPAPEPSVYVNCHSTERECPWTVIRGSTYLHGCSHSVTSTLARNQQPPWCPLAETKYGEGTAAPQLGGARASPSRHRSVHKYVPKGKTRCTTECAAHSCFLCGQRVHPSVAGRARKVPTGRQETESPGEWRNEDFYFSLSYVLLSLIYSLFGSYSFHFLRLLMIMSDLVLTFLGTRPCFPYHKEKRHPFQGLRETGLSYLPASGVQTGGWPWRPDTVTPATSAESGELARGFSLPHRLSSFSSQGLVSVLDKRGFCGGGGGRMKLLSCGNPVPLMSTAESDGTSPKAPTLINKN